MQEHYREIGGWVRALSQEAMTRQGRAMIHTSVAAAALRRP